MTLTRSSCLLGTLIAVAGIFVSVSGALEATMLSVVVASIFSLMLIFLARLVTGEYTNLTFIFVAFFALYGVSGPINAVVGNDLHSLFPLPYATDLYLVAYGLAISGIATGLILAAALVGGRFYKPPSNLPNKSVFVAVSLMLAFLATTMEFVNWYRVEGWELMFMGKAAYQSAISELTGTLPSSHISFVAAAFLGLGLSKRLSSGEWLKVALFLLILSPMLLMLMLLGGRGNILKMLLVFFIARSFVSPVVKIRLGLLVFAVFLYVVMGALFQVRGSIGITIQEGRYSDLTERISRAEFWVSALNPGANEFGAAFGNFSTFVSVGEWGRKFGATYLDAFVGPVPRFIWPNKPQSVTYSFRDYYFPSEKSRGVIAGTAFSSILEAYMNFGFVGVYASYVVFAFLLVALERRKKGRRTLLFSLFYSLLAPVVMSFHRSSLGGILFWPVFFSLFGYLFYLCIAAFYKRNSSESWSAMS